MTNTERRIKFRQGLSPLYLPVYDALCEQLPMNWAPYSGARSFDEQAQLYSVGRTRMGAAPSVKFPMGKTVTDADVGESPHNYGCATDWVSWDEHGSPIWSTGKGSPWVVYEEACQKVGAICGADFLRVDRPHNELSIDCDWKHVLAVFNKNGMRAAMEFIEERASR